MTSLPLVRPTLLVLALLPLCACPPPSPPPPPAEVVVRPAGEAGRWFAADIDAGRALELVGFLDRRFREPGNAPYRESLDEVESRLRGAGFGADDRLTLERWTLDEDAPTWEPLAASLEVVSPEVETLQSFSAADDRERTMLLIGSPGTAGSLEVDLVRDGEADPKGRAVLARGMPEAEYGRLAEAGASVALFGADARVEGRVSDDGAIPFGSVAAGDWGPVALRLSRATERRLRDLLATGKPVVLRVAASVRVERGPVEMLHAEVRGGPLPGLVVAAHLDEPGAEDNASGVAVAAALAELFGRGIRDGGAPAPNRSLHFVVGPEIAHAEETASRLRGTVGWAIALDQVGRPRGPQSSPHPTRALVERAPDPSQRWRADIGPGSGWMAGGDADEATWSRAAPSLLADVLVALLGGADRGWESHPFEGGSDHVPFLAAGVPSALVWKFPDPTYHTSLDRIGPSVVSSDELAEVGRGCAAMLASLGWEDGATVARAAAAPWETRAGVVAALTPGAAAACAWGRWLEQAADELETMLGAACTASPATAAALAEILGAATRLGDECLRSTIGSGRGGRRGGGA
ncbi:MAG: hypothetical protein HY907_00640 [Deltaproteobacteria bacterium]|nr:hypothetical protein [Deltaproteobacteria bacterium]